MDYVRIEKLRVDARVGVTELERATPQQVLIDLRIGLDLSKAGKFDDLTSTIDYAAVCARVRGLAETKKYKLVEAMAEAIADIVLREFNAEQVRVRVRKYSVPGALSVGTEITRP